MRILVAAREAAAREHAARQPFQVFRFLDLPPELRNKIYRMILVRRRPIVIREQDRRTVWGNHEFVPTKRSMYWAKEDELLWNGPTLTTYSTEDDAWDQFDLEARLLCVNRLIRKETASVFYSENTFRFYDTDAVIPFLKDQSSEVIELIAKVELVFRIDNDGIYYGCGSWQDIRLCSPVS